MIPARFVGSIALVVTAVLTLGLAGPPAVRDAAAQTPAAGSSAVDARVQPLIGTWEGRVELRGAEDPDRILIIEQRNGELAARFGSPGKRLEPVQLEVDTADATSPSISFRTRAGAQVKLSLKGQDSLSGVFVVARRKGRESPEHPMQLVRKKD